MRRLITLASATFLAVASLALVAATSSADTDPNVSPVTFDTCGTKAWVVPAGVTSATFDIFGAGGGDGHGDGLDNPHSPGGQGGHSTAALQVTPGETLTIVVGCQGGDSDDAPGDTPGGSGSGSGGASGTDSNEGGGGGGGTAVARGATRLLVAGGGGGGGASTDLDEAEGGDGGGANQNGTDGESASTFGCPAGGGGGGTTSNPGAGGTAPNGGTNGSPGVGANGGFGPAGSGTSAGGGGGGYRGGGGGASVFNNPCGGGGGASGYADPSATDVAAETGVQDGNGLVTITFVAGPTLVVSFTG